MKKRILAIGLGTVLTLAMLTGCGKDSTPATPDTQVTETMTNTSTETIVNEVVKTIVEKTDEEVIEAFLEAYHLAVLKAESPEDADAIIEEFNNNNDKFIIIDYKEETKRFIDKVLSWVREKYDVNNLTVKFRDLNNSQSNVDYQNELQMKHKEVRDNGGTMNEKNTLEGRINIGTGWNEDYYVVTEVRVISCNALYENDEAVTSGGIDFDVYKVEGHDEWIVMPR